MSNKFISRFGCRITARHVIDQFRADRQNHNVSAMNISTDPGVPIDLDGTNGIIDEDEAIDIATFRIEQGQIDKSKKTVLRGHQADWPPQPPQEGRGIYYSGYPEIETIWPRRDEINFGAAPASGIATSVSDQSASSQIERQHLTAAFGKGIPPENYDFSGLSGGPMLTVVQGALRSWRLVSAP